MNLQLTETQKKVLDWIVKEWNDDWDQQLYVEIEGSIDFPLKNSTIKSLIDKGMIEEGSVNDQTFTCKFNPMQVLKFYNKYDYDEFVTPNGNSILF